MAWHEKLFDKFQFVNRYGEHQSFNGILSSFNLNGTTSSSYIGIFFSALWCPPGCKFTPKLVEFYDCMKKSQDKQFEIVFISSDKDHDDFHNYLDKMPFYGLEYDWPNAIIFKNKVIDLQKRFKVSGIPSLIILDANDGTVIRFDGRYMVTNDPNGTFFPWFQKSLSEILKGPLIKNSTIFQANDVLNSKIFMILFSAQWCPPCREFTEKLKETDLALRKLGKVYEIIVCSADRNMESFHDHVSTLPAAWYVLPFGDDRKDLVCRHFQVTGIPSLILVDENMQTIRKNGRLCITVDRSGDNFPWRPKIVEELNDISAQSINDQVSLIIFTEGVDSHVKNALECLEAIAKEYRQRSDAVELLFLYENITNQATESIKSYAELDERVPLILLLDVPSQKMYVDENNFVNLNLLRKIINDYCNGRLIMSDIPE